MGFRRTFPRFNELPPELKIMIYRLVNLPTRVIIEFDPVLHAVNGNWVSVNPGLRVRTTRPAIHHVNRFARQTILQGSELVFGDIDGRPVYFDFRRDTLDINLNDAAMQTALQGFEWPQNANLARDLERVRSLRLYWGTGSVAADFTEDGPLYRPMPNLRRLQYPISAWESADNPEETGRQRLLTLLNDLRDDKFIDPPDPTLSDDDAAIWSEDNVSPDAPTIKWLSQAEVDDLLVGSEVVFRPQSSGSGSSSSSSGGSSLNNWFNAFATANS